MENKIDTKTVLNYSEGKYSWNDYLKVKEWFGNSRDCMKIEGRCSNNGKPNWEQNI